MFGLYTHQTPLNKHLHVFSAPSPHVVLKYSLMSFVHTKVTLCRVVMHLSHQVYSELCGNIESRPSFLAFWHMIKPIGWLFIFGFSMHLHGKLGINDNAMGI